MWRVMGWLQKQLVWSVPIFMISGIMLGYFFDLSSLKALIIPFTFLMVYPMMINLQVDKILVGGSWRLQAIAQGINFLIIPFLSYGVGWLFFRDQPLIWLGLLLTGLLPTSGMTISWTGFAKGNLTAAIQMTVMGLILGSLATPIYANLLLGQAVEIPLSDTFKQIAIVVFFPMILGVITKKIIIMTVGQQKYEKSLKQKFPAFSTLGVLGIVFVAMALKATSIVANPLTLVSYFLPLIIIYVANFALSTIVGKIFFNREDSIALVYSSHKSVVRFF